MTFKEIVAEVKEMIEPFSYDYNTEETRAAIIEAISEHTAVGTVIDKTSESDIINAQVAKFGVEINGMYVTISVPLL